MADTEEAAQSRLAQQPALATRRVLVVDDNADSAESLKRLLTREGYQVMALQSPLKAVELAQVFTPHVAIIDVSMPIMDGLALCRYMRELPVGKQMFFLAISGFDYTDEQIRSAGFEEIFLKPIDWPRLQAALAQYWLV